MILAIIVIMILMLSWVSSGRSVEQSTVFLETRYVKMCIRDRNRHWFKDCINGFSFFGCWLRGEGDILDEEPAVL